MKLVLIILFICIIVGFFLYEKKRGDELAQFSRQAGFTLQKGQQRLPKKLDNAGFYLFTQGAPYAMNFMQGNRGDYQITLLEYFFDAAFGDEGDRYLPNSDNDGQAENHAQLVAWIQSDTLELPEFDLSPSNSPIRSASRKFGYHPVRFDHANDFNKAFNLAGRDSQALRKLFGKKLQDFLLTHPQWVIESRGKQWLLYQPDRRTNAKVISSWLDDIQEFLDLTGGSSAYNNTFQ